GAIRKPVRRRRIEMADEKKDKKAAKPTGDKKGAEKKVKGKKGEGAAGFELAPAGQADQKKGPARLRIRYKTEMLPALMKELNLENRMQAPRVEKVVVNMGLGEAITNNKIIDAAVQQIAALTGQKPVVTRSRKAIANFKLRAGQPIGVMVTLRSDRA